MSSKKHRLHEILAVESDRQYAQRMGRLGNSQPFAIRPLERAPPQARHARRIIKCLESNVFCF